MGHLETILKPPYPEAAPLKQQASSLYESMVGTVVWL